MNLSPAARRELRALRMGAEIAFLWLVGVGHLLRWWDPYIWTDTPFRGIV